MTATVYCLSHTRFPLVSHAETLYSHRPISSEGKANVKRLLVPVVCLAFLTAACTSNDDASPSGSASSGGASD